MLPLVGVCCHSDGNKTRALPISQEGGPEGLPQLVSLAGQSNREQWGSCPRYDSDPGKEKGRDAQTF